MALAQPTPIGASGSGSANTNDVDLLTIPGPTGSFAVVNIYASVGQNQGVSVRTNNFQYSFSGRQVIEKQVFDTGTNGSPMGVSLTSFAETPPLIGVVLKAGDVLKIQGLGSVSVSGLFYKAS